MVCVVSHRSLCTPQKDTVPVVTITAAIIDNLTHVVGLFLSGYLAIHLNPRIRPEMAIKKIGVDAITAARASDFPMEILL